MDRTKLNIIVCVACFIMLLAFTFVELQKIDELERVKVLLNDTDSACCNVYRSPIMPQICGLKKIVNQTVEPINFSRLTT